VQRGSNGFATARILKQTVCQSSMYASVHALQKGSCFSDICTVTTSR